MSVSSFDPSQVVQITEDAQEHFRKQVAADASANAIRLSVKQAGCTGWKYVVDLVDAPKAGDIEQIVTEGFAFYIDPDAIGVVGGTQIDYVTQGVNRQLVFNNPRVKDYCGCGESFNVE